MTSPTGIETPTVAERLAVERVALSLWERRRDDAVAEHGRLTQSAGAQVLDDPSAVDDVAGKLGRLQAEIEMAERAIAAQRPRVLQAETALLEADLDQQRASLARHRAELEQHEAKTADLLAQLETHEGKHIALSEHHAALNSGRQTMRDWLDIPPMKSTPLRGAIETGGRRVRVLELLVAGEDPRLLLQAWRDPFAPSPSYLPNCVVGTQPLVPLAPYLKARAELAANTD